MKHRKDHESKHHNKSFKIINSTKTINVLINNIAGMGIRTNKSQQFIKKYYSKRKKTNRETSKVNERSY
jgi:hypothetical protein